MTLASGGALGGRVGALLGRFRNFWVFFWPSWTVLEPSSPVLKPYGAVLRPYWASQGAQSPESSVLHRFWYVDFKRRRLKA
eukprot:8762655-Pyramimonas_sp.AAC.1